MPLDAASELWSDAYRIFKHDEAELFAKFQQTIRKNNTTGKDIKLGSEDSQQQLVAFISEKMKASEQQTKKFPSFQKVVKLFGAPKDLVMTASAASPPVNAASSFSTSWPSNAEIGGFMTRADRAHRPWLAFFSLSQYVR
jgi:hypothetical protein